MTFNFARLKPGVSVAAAEAALAVIAKDLEREYPEENTGRGVGLLPVNEARVPPELRRNFEMAGALLFGLVPALGATRPEVVSSLKLGAGMASGRPRLLSLRHLLVAGQVALSLVALITSALFLRSLGNATAIDLGFDGD